MDSALSKTESELVAAWKTLDRRDLLARYELCKEIASFADELPAGHKSRFAEQLGMCPSRLCLLCRVPREFSDRHILKLADAGWTWTRLLLSMTDPVREEWPSGGLPQGLAKKADEQREREAEYQRQITPQQRKEEARERREYVRQLRIKTADMLPAPDLLSLALAKLSPAQVCNAFESYLRDSCKPSRAEAICKGLSAVVARATRVVRSVKAA